MSDINPLVHTAELVESSSSAEKIRAIVRHGKPISLQVMPGVFVQAVPFVEKDRIGLQIMGDTPIGEVGGVIYTSPKTFERMVAYVDEHPDTLKRAGLMLEHVTGHRPLLAR